VRVYLPATTVILRELLETSMISGAPLVAFAVTPGLREWYVDDDAEELEYAALTEAARASLRLLDADSRSEPRRVVVAAELPDASVTTRDDLDRGVVHLSAAVMMADVASVHVDDRSAEDVIARAAESIIAADLGDLVAQEAVDDAEGFELAWYASQEIGPLLELG
jgi:hypothetical protein